MARVTIEDCLRNVKNRFELVMIAAKRARQLMRGKEPKVEWDNDKATVVALREIAEGFTNFDNQEVVHELHHPETHTLHLTTEVEITELDLKDDVEEVIEVEVKTEIETKETAAPEVEKTVEVAPEDKPTTPPTETE